ncbi:hypothetical protein B0J12DRAFT_214938 [Macrophomina phaseolina]|uniref:Uncharacterized protein n=1 Tax=Macrophomina phaseolina TaxID=35725 RepID=A0ABQ8G1N8_9PEZI|nr:hypothetical protein B0J12DRAFT_214938 [Macrophomina phaseolina]
MRQQRHSGPRAAGLTVVEHVRSKANRMADATGRSQVEVFVDGVIMAESYLDLMVASVSQASRSGGERQAAHKDTLEAVVFRGSVKKQRLQRTSGLHLITMQKQKSAKLRHFIAHHTPLAIEEIRRSELTCWNCRCPLHSWRLEERRSSSIALERRRNPQTVPDRLAPLLRNEPAIHAPEAQRSRTRALPHPVGKFGRASAGVG